MSTGQGPSSGSKHGATDAPGSSTDVEAGRTIELRYQRLVELSPFAIAIHSQGLLRYANPTCLEIFKVPEQDLILGRPILDFVHPDSHAAVRERVALVYEKSASSQIIEEKMLRLDGEPFDAVVAVAPMTYEGEPAAQVVIQDISRRKQAERALAESEEKFRSLAESSPNIIFINRGGHVSYVNARACIVLGYSRDEFYADTFDFMCLIAPESVDAVTRALAQRARGQVVEPYECTLRTKRDQRLFSILSTDQVELQGERAILGVVTDISARRRAEQRVHELNEALERRVTERTAQLEAVNSELEAFVYSVSHDLRSPLHHINGFAEALQDEFGEVLGEQGLHYLSRMRQGVEQMSGLIEDLLRLSRLSRAELQRMDIDLSSLCRVIVDELSSETAPRRFAVEIEAGLHVRADANLLRVALENLLSNAFKFTRLVDDARIEVGQILGAELDGEVPPGQPVLYVRDTGVGFDMKQADRLFAPFQRLHRQSDYPGQGVGLATVQRIITRHGGRIWARSKPGEGATFYFTLPDAVVEA
ncbi:MAG: PAS domain S-box protein [Pseudomonadota bacterium]